MRLLPRRLGHGEEATLVEHLGELRARLVISLLAIMVGLAVAYAFRGDIIHWLTQPLPEGKRKLVTLSPAEPFITSFMLSFYAGFLAAIPVVFWQIWAFLAPAFQERTQRVVAAFTAFATALLGAGVAFGYFVALPAAVRFLTDYDSNLYTIQIRARDYLSFAALVLMATALVFELPIFILALVRIGVLTTRKLRRNRRLGYVLMAALAVALPGVDPVTTTLEMIPLMVLYEGSIWLAVFFDRRWKSAAAAREAAFEGLEL
jgi:sec-independent protein translocase protein TatC